MCVFNILCANLQKIFGDYKIKSYLCIAKQNRDVAQLVAHTSGGREVASSSLVIPTQSKERSRNVSLFCCYRHLGIIRGQRIFPVGISFVHLAARFHSIDEVKLFLEY